MIWLGPAEWEAVNLSLRVACVATLLALPFGIYFGWLLARCDFPGKSLLSTLIHLPLVLPPVVTGYLLLITFGPTGMMGQVLAQLGLPVAFRWTGAALAAAIMGFPLMVRAIRLSMEAVDPQLEEAARTLGASRLRVFFTITLPIAASGILAGSVLSFAKAMGEFGATITFVSNIPGETRTIPSAVYAFLQTPGQEGAAVKLVVLSILIAFAALAFSEYLSRRMEQRNSERATS